MHLGIKRDDDAAYMAPVVGEEVVEVVHVTKTLLTQTAICGEEGVNVIQFGMGPGDTLCEGCGKVLNDLDPDNLPGWAKTVLVPEVNKEGQDDG